MSYCKLGGVVLSKAKVDIMKQFVFGSECN